MNSEASIPQTVLRADYEALIELVEAAAAQGLNISLSVHNVPSEVGLAWLQAGLIDRIERGASTNPPTARLGSSDRQGAVADVYFKEVHR